MTKIRADKVAEILRETYPEFKTLLNWWNDPFKLLIAVSNSAQTTDAAINKITPILWKRFPTANDLANAKLEDVEQILRPIGFYKNKAKNTIACSKMIVEKYDGSVPDTMDELVELPGVGRKTANIILNLAFNKVEGIAVDTHVFRICKRLRFTNAKTPAAAEKDLLEVFDKKHWRNINNHLVRFGRETCSAMNPHCEYCPLTDLCPEIKAQ